MNNKSANMKAVICTKYGGPEVLQIREVPVPIPKSHEVKIKIYATSVTAADFRIRSFTIPPAYKLIARFVLGFTKPRKNILGVEFSGVVEEVGNKVTKFKKGDKVFAATLNQFGAYAEYICMPETATISLMPQNSSYAEAATLPIGALTANHFIKAAELTPHKKILIYGASGSVGTYALQLAKLTGAEITAVSSLKNQQLVTELGANKFIDYTAPDFESQLATYDVVFVAVDKLPFTIANRVLKSGGIYINITAPFKSKEMKQAAKKESKTIITGKDPAMRASDLDEIKTLVESFKLKSIIDKTYPLTSITAAHHYTDQGHKKGNVAIMVVDENKL